jgi:methyl-accepting chemotaxis protein
MKIRIKLVAVIAALNILGIGILAAVSMVYARLQIRTLATENALNIARQKSETVKNWISMYMDSSRTMAEIMARYETVPAQERRSFCNDILKGVMAAHPEITGAWSVWEPNALDGLDREYADTPGTDASGRYISYWSLDGGGNLKLEPIAGYQTGAYYTIPKNTGNEAVIEPYIYSVSGQDYLITTLSVPIKNRSVVVGVCGIDIQLSHIQDIVKEIHPYGDGVAAAFSNKGVVAAHFDPSRIGKNMKDTEKDMAGPNLNNFMQAIADGKEFMFVSGDMQIYAVPFNIDNAGDPWSLAVAANAKTIMAPVNRMLIMFIIIGAVTSVITSSGAFFIASSISRPIVYTKTVLEAISEGDLTRQIETASKDEMADLAEYINFTMEKIKAMVKGIKNQASILSHTGNELAANMTETAAAINEITANIQSITGQVNRQSKSVKQTDAVMATVVHNIEALNGHIKRQTDSLSRSSSAIEELLASIQSVTQTLIKNVENVSNLSEASELGRTGLQEVSSDIQEISRESEGLLEINAVMENIASQTNLLSMNAAIEAAHAGEAGKGFAVVADEIRKLAENSSEQSKTISAVLKKIKDSIDKITKSTDAVLLKFDAINDGVRTVMEQEQNIRNAMEEEEAGSKQILDAMNELIEISGNVKKGSQEMYQGSHEVIQESKNLLQVTGELANGIEEMASGANQINSAVMRVNEISVDNKTQIEKLVSEVSVFKVE